MSRQFALDDVLEKPIGKLSRGYRQRVGLAQAMLHDPEVLIMDEPTAGLDPNQIREFRSSIQELGKRKTILISTHILQEVDAVADRVLFVHDGRMIFDGSPRELMQDGSLERSFYRMTQAGHRRGRRLDRGRIGHRGGRSHGSVRIGRWRVKRPEINTTFVLALVKRDLWKYFTSPTGYVFITLFILLSTAAAFWQDRFFLDNLANLDQLNYMFPYLLLFFIPALTMSVWSEERKQGTDELLFTLPATSLEIVIGKYLATLGIYTASLVLSLSHVLVLGWLGSPDLGLMFSNYVGYWLLGGALIAVGMLASLLTANATIAFIMGAVFCAFFVLIDLMGSLGAGLDELVAPLGVYRHFDDFARGVMSFSGLLYFLSIAGLMLYLNVLVVEKRHWPREADGRPLWLHHSMRTVGLVLAVIGLNLILGRAGLRGDATAEGLHSLSDETVSLISELSDDRPVFIQAYVSPEVPEQLVQTRANLLGVLGEIESVGGARVQVLIEDTEPFTQAARDAREKFGITPRQVPHLGSARAGFTDVFLGVAFTCGAEEQVTPFLERGLPIEYEITRSVRVVAKTERKTVGILGTEAKLFGGFDFQSMRSNPSWPVVEELRKQYDVVQVSPAAPIRQELDGLFAALPSSLPQPELDNLLEYMQQGHPTLLLVDPLPIVNIGLSPSERSGANVNPFQRQQGPPPKPKGDILTLLARIGVRWDKAGIVWDSYNPHPDLAHLPEEVVFVGEGNDNEQAFNREHPASVALQELVFLFPGHLKREAGSDLEFQPLGSLRPGVGGPELLPDGSAELLRSPIGPQASTSAG